MYHLYYFCGKIFFKSIITCCYRLSAGESLRNLEWLQLLTNIFFAALQRLQCYLENIIFILTIFDKNHFKKLKILSFKIFSHFKIFLPPKYFSK